jgi:mevalonate kinase
MNTNPWVQILGILNTFVKTKGLAISITSDIPINAGLGSSGSLALSLVAAVYHFVNGNPIKQSDLFETAKSIENIFHGKQGSGLDVAVSLNGGLVLY